MNQASNKDILDSNWKRFGDYLAECRRKKGISQTEAGRRAGMSRTQWTRIELGESGTKIENIEPMANAVDANILKAYDLAGYVPPSQRGVDKRSEAGTKAQRLVESLPEERQQDAIWILEGFYKRYGNLTALPEQAQPLASDPQQVGRSPRVIDVNKPKPGLRHGEPHVHQSTVPRTPPRENQLPAETSEKQPRRRKAG